MIYKNSIKSKNAAFSLMDTLKAKQISISIVSLSKRILSSLKQKQTNKIKQEQIAHAQLKSNTN